MSQEQIIGAGFISLCTSNRWFSYDRQMLLTFDPETGLAHITKFNRTYGSNRPAILAFACVANLRDLRYLVNLFDELY